MREFWANEAAMMRDKSALLGNLEYVLDKSVLKSASTGKESDSTSEEFETGYWLDEKTKTIVFSCYIYNATTHSDEKIIGFINKVVAIQGNFSAIIKETSYSFKFLYKFIKRPRYDYWNIYGNSRDNKNPKIKPYILKIPNTRSQDDLKGYFEESSLPNEYYMDLFDLNPTAKADGGTHINTNNPYKSCYFGLSVASDLSNARTVVHESLHPVIPHIYTSESPLNGLFKDFFAIITQLINERRKQGLSNEISKKQINDYIVSNGDLEKKATIIRKNIMTTEALFIMSDNAEYQLLTPYLYEYLGSTVPTTWSITKTPLGEVSINTGGGILNKGERIEASQVEMIKNKIPKKKE